MSNKILNAKETADFLKISVVSLYRLVSLGQIQCFRIGRIYRFSEEQIAEFIECGGGCTSAKVTGGDHDGIGKINSQGSLS